MFSISSTIPSSEPDGSKSDAGISTIRNVYFNQYNISYSPSSVAGCWTFAGSSVCGLIHFKKKDSLFFLFFFFGLLSAGCGEDGTSCCRRVSAGRLLRVYAIKSLNSRLSAAYVWTSPLLCCWSLLMYAKCFWISKNEYQKIVEYQVWYIQRGKIIWSPADFVCFPTDKEMISL